MSPAPDAVLTAIATSDRFLLQQALRPLANEYRISIPAPGSSEEGEPLLFVKQKRMKIKEDIRFRLGDGDGPHLFAIASKTVFEFRGPPRRPRRHGAGHRDDREGLRPIVAPQPLAVARRGRHRALRGPRGELDHRAPPPAG
jgi:hypothetical protein